MARILILLIVFSLLLSCSNSVIQITGNINKPFEIKQTGSLFDILQQNKIPAEYALVIAVDGTAFIISERSFSEIEIEKNKGKFSTVSTSLPPVCNLKNITEICIYNSDFPLTDRMTPFSTRIADFEFLGQNSKNGHFVRKYKLKEKSK